MRSRVSYSRVEAVRTAACSMRHKSTSGQDRFYKIVPHWRWHGSNLNSYRNKDRLRLIQLEAMIFLRNSSSCFGEEN
jgi:hypothetical protein